MGFDAARVSRYCGRVVGKKGSTMKTGAYIRYKPNHKGGFDVMTAEGKRGRIETRRGAFRFVMTRHVSNAVLDGVSHFVQDLNNG
jgi:hypothetical protein